MKFTKESSTIDKFICSIILAIYAIMTILVLGLHIDQNSFWDTLLTYFIWGTIFYAGKLSAKIDIVITQRRKKNELR